MQQDGHLTEVREGVMQKDGHHPEGWAPCSGMGIVQQDEHHAAGWVLCSRTGTVPRMGSMQNRHCMFEGSCATSSLGESQDGE